MKIAGIYEIESPTGALYIGQSIDIMSRWRHYKTLNCKKQPLIYNSLKKYGPSTHKFTIKISFPTGCSRIVLDYLEISYIDYYKTIGTPLLNLTVGGKTCSISEGTKIKISQSLKKRARLLGLKEKPKVKYPRVGGVFSEEQKTRYREERKGSLNSFFGKKHCHETRIKMSEASKTNKIGTKNGRHRKISQYDLNMNLLFEYDTIIMAATKLGISRQSINSCCSGRHKTGHGYIWKYRNIEI